MPKLLLASLVMGILGAALLIVPGMVVAGPTLPSDPPPPGLHRHYIVLPDSTTREVGPDWCDNQDSPAITLAFYHFHYNVHFGAPGLHNSLGTEVKGHGGCGPIPATG